MSALGPLLPAGWRRRVGKLWRDYQVVRWVGERVLWLMAGYTIARVLAHVLK